MPHTRKYLKSLHRIRPKRSVLKSKWFWLAVLIVGGISVAIYFLIFFPGVQVKNITIAGNQKVSSIDINDIVFGSVHKEFLGGGDWEFGSASIFLVNSHRLENDILNRFSEIENVQIKKNFFQSLSVKILERMPVAIFCPADKFEGCYFVDSTGTAFESALEIPSSIFIVRQSGGGLGITLGKNAVDQNIIDSLLKLEKSLRDNFQINIKEALVESPIKLNVVTSEDWKIYLDPSVDINRQITKINLLLDKEILPKDRQNLRYINLIPDGKAIICDNSTCGG